MGWAGIVVHFQKNGDPGVQESSCSERSVRMHP